MAHSARLVARSGSLRTIGCWALYDESEVHSTVRQAHHRQPYAIIIHKDPDSDYGVTVPDLPGCFSAGDSYADALENAQEAIECHIEGMLEDGESLPAERPDQDYAELTEAGGVLALVTVDISKLSGKTKRINITLPERIIHQVDTYAGTHGDSRSGLLATAALDYISTHR